MRYYDNSHKFTCGIDLHAKSMHVCVFDEGGKKLVHRKMNNDGAEFLRVLQPYRSDVVVSVESTFNWYWLGDLCCQEGIPFVLGHAHYMKAIHQGKTKNDRIDSEKITRLTSARMLPQSYVYPREMREVRDLLRRRLYFTRERAALKGHVKIVAAQYNVPLVLTDGNTARRHKELLSCFPDRDLQESIDCDLRTVTYLDSVVRRLEKHVLSRVKVQDEDSLKLLLSMPGLGNVLGLTILYEMHNLKRFPRCQDFMSYARLVRADHLSDNKKVGKGSRKIGNPYLKWAFSELAVHLARVNPEVASLVENLKVRYGAAGAWGRLSQKAARTVYYMLKSKKPFDLERFLKSSKETSESSNNSLEPTEVAMVVD